MSFNRSVLGTMPPIDPDPNFYSIHSPDPDFRQTIETQMIMEDKPR